MLLLFRIYSRPGLKYLCFQGDGVLRELIDCNEGTLEWVPYDQEFYLNQPGKAIIPCWWLLEDRPSFQQRFVYMMVISFARHQVDFDKGGKNTTNQEWPCNGPKSGLDQVCDVLVEGKKIVKIGQNLEAADADPRC